MIPQTRVRAAVVGSPVTWKEIKHMFNIKYCECCGQPFHVKESSIYCEECETAIEYEKKDNPIQLISELYCERLGELFPFVTPEPLVMKNNHNVPIFHFVCASFNQTAVEIAQQIIDKRQ